jgi:tetratricopeptide (TPR) repeat protein
MRFLGPAAVCIALSLGVTACAGQSPVVGTPEGPIAAPIAVGDAEFAAKLHQVLRDGTPQDAQAERLGVARALLTHATARFELGADEHGMSSVLGAVYLLRRGELTAGLLDPRSTQAIDAAIERLSARGDDGRVRVLLSLRIASAQPAEKAELEAHLRELERWSLEARTGKPIEQAGDAERSAVGRAIFDPTAIDEAVVAIGRWIDLAIEHNIAFRETGKRPSPEEATEIARALDSGATTVVALLLRYGDAAGAAERVDTSSARRIADPDFYVVLRQAADRNDAQSWRALFAALSAETEGHVGGELGIDAELLDAASFGIALEAYRRDPTHLPTAVELSRSLSALGMSEAVPMVLGDALRERATKEELSGALVALAEAVDADADVGDLAGARRTIDAAAPLLETMRRAGVPSQPSVADVEYRMASVLVRGGYLVQAKPFLTSALSTSPRASGYFVLALVERNQKDPSHALERLQTSVAAKGADPLDIADAQLLSFEIHRDAGNAAGAERALVDALGQVTRVLDRDQAGTVRVRALRTLGRVLMAYGDAQGAARAFARALEAVTGDRGLIGATMLQATSAALVTKDVKSARAALQRGLEAGVAREDLVYGALWLSFVERQLGEKPDGTAGEILEAAAGQGNWIGKLAAWGRGKVTDEALAAHANSEATKVEAAFYVAMAKRARGLEADDSLRRVADSPVLDLMEVQIARELVAPRLSLTPPKGVKIP